ncbi:hypothetical protein TPA0907_55490 [Micromonospora humidisoli]|uniref:hypothetical protein n=1 Tax=Micromonospora sp. AKA109 TaxID=2733865 RepID=UPI0022C96A92|nr:hypothetical protein [Micromonospora sp. AKA109]GHJ11182.1 hypothetical protein TPA0907_55490 [Micromonospora sp. AKA109]
MTAVDPSPVTAWPTRQPLHRRIAAWLTSQQQDRPAGRHRAGTIREVTPDYSPLHPADRLRLNPSRWQNPDVALPAPEGERTGCMDPAVVRDLAAPPEWPGPVGDTSTVLADLRAALVVDEVGTGKTRVDGPQ